MKSSTLKDSSCSLVDFSWAKLCQLQQKDIILIKNMGQCQTCMIKNMQTAQLTLADLPCTQRCILLKPFLSLVRRSLINKEHQHEQLTPPPCPPSSSNHLTGLQVENSIHPSLRHHAQALQRLFGLIFYIYFSEVSKVHI